MQILSEGAQFSFQNATFSVLIKYLIKALLKIKCQWVVAVDLWIRLNAAYHRT